MNKQPKLIYRNLATYVSMACLVLVMMTWLSVSATNVLAATGLTQDSVSALTPSPRLSTDATKLWVNGTETVTVTFTDRTAEEDIELSLSKKAAADIVKNEWDGSTCRVTITSKKTCTATLTIHAGDETCKVTLYLHEPKVLESTEVYDYATEAMVEIQTKDSNGVDYVGSGFFIGNGLVLTNYHVVSSASKITIVDYSGKEYKIKSVVHYDFAEDMILFKVSATNKAAFTLADSVRGGAEAYLIGSPIGLTGSMAQGIVAKPEQMINDAEKGTLPFVQLAIATGTGFGGGPILNNKGQLMGIMTLTVPAAECMAFAIPPERITAFLDEAANKKPIKPATFYKRHAGGVKESNIYDISVPGSAENTSAMYATAFTEKSGEEIYDMAHDAMVEVWIDFNETVTSNGSGFFVNSDTVVTNVHVISGHEIPFVQDYNGHKYRVVDKRTNDIYDIAVLTVEPFDGGRSEHGTLELNPAYVPAVGEKVYAYGSPVGYTGTFSSGIVSMSNRTVGDVDYIWFTSPVSPGNSGGALLNKYGHVIGVVRAKVTVLGNMNMAVRVKYLSQVGN